MKRIRYSRYVPNPADSIDLEQLLGALSSFLLESGFESQYMNFTEMDSQRSMEALREAIRRALEEGDLLPEDVRQQLADMAGDRSDSSMDELIDALIARLEQEGYLAADGANRPQVTEPPTQSALGGVGKDRQTRVRFEITDKTIDFLGFKALRDLLASVGRSSFGRHDTRELATGVESGGASRAYEFGDTLNLDTSETLLHAIRREGLGVPLNIEHSDLYVHQCEYHSSCATVLMLDCSHSMILYGEDRFTPAKTVALALAHLIRTQYPGDSLHLVLFHDSAEEIPLAQLARVQVGPYYTNTREGLRLASRILERQKKDMKQIVMITDGKPSALTLEDGRIYKNAFGLDPLVISETLNEVAKCKRSGTLINTFMLANDYSLVRFVKKVAEMCRGKAYFTTPQTLGQYLLMDFVSRKSRMVH